MRGEDWKEFSGFERNTRGLREFVAGRRGVEDRYDSLEYKRRDWRGLEGLGRIEWIGGDWRGLEG